MRKVMIIVVVIMAMAFAFTSTTISKGKVGGKNFGAGGAMGKGINMVLDNPVITEELGLTDAQTEKLKALKMETAKQRIKSQADVQILQLELEDLLDRDKPDVKKVDSIIEKIGSKQTEMHKQMVHTMIDIKSILTEEQREKIQKLIAERKQGKHGERGQRQGKGSRHGMGAGMGFGPGGGPGDSLETD